jgi:hypothetical protein
MNYFPIELKNIGDFMKTILTILALICVQGAFAQNVTELGSDDLALSQAMGTIISNRSICPKIPGQISCMAIGSVLEIQVDLNGCLDHLGGHFEKFAVVDGKGILYFSAINVINEGSKTARCFTRPLEKITITTPFRGEIELVNLNFTGTEKK